MRWHACGKASMQSCGLMVQESYSCPSACRAAQHKFATDDLVHQYSLCWVWSMLQLSSCLSV